VGGIHGCHLLWVGLSELPREIELWPVNPQQLGRQRILRFMAAQLDMSLAHAIALGRNVRDATEVGT
jgi:hypothetical protein